MCGIVGYVGSRPCEELLVGALERLEYRGYDSAGLSVLADGQFERVRSVGNLSRLREAVVRRRLDGAVATLAAEATIGVGHTRWATHGGVTRDNAHPHSDSKGRIHVVLNGIVENHIALRDRLTEQGAVFRSQTDAEAVAHLISEQYEGDLVAAVQAARRLLRGHYAFVAVSVDEPQLLVAARKECPLVVGRGHGECFVASAIPAFLAETRRVQLVEDDEVVAVGPGSAQFFGAADEPLDREQCEVDWDDEQAGRGDYETYMLKEIWEQPNALRATIASAVFNREIEFDEIGITDIDLAAVERIQIVACGTSYNAGLAGRYAIERWARLPVEFEIASEFRYREPIVGPGDLVIGITQSGETADTLAAMRLASERGARVLALTNVRGSQATRDADGTLYTLAGPEVGVAATKTFTAQVATLYLLGLKLAAVRGSMPWARWQLLLSEIEDLPDAVERTLITTSERVKGVAEQFGGSDFFLFLGRHGGMPVALEGALKLKEISYIPCDAYAAGEMKHGPIALLSARTPVVCCATDSPVLDKMLSNLSEVRARGASVIAIATEGSQHVAEHAEQAIYVPRTDPLLQPLLAVIPMQLLAYEIARARGLNVDQPRNLAKTVTVE